MSTHQKNILRIAIVAALVLVAIMSRILPNHTWNMTATGAAALFAGAAFGLGWAAFLVPLASLWVSDLLLSNYVYPSGSGFTWAYPGIGYTYAAYMVAVVLGAILLRKSNALRVAGVSIGASLVFFLISNFGVWITADQYPIPMYTKTLDGLMACYTMGLPFLRNTLIGDLLFAEVFFMAYAWAQGRVPALKAA